MKEQKEEPKVEQKPPMRQVVIETDGSNINISKNECSTLELQAILLKILNTINREK